MKSSALIPFIVVVAACSAQAAEITKDPTEPPVSHFRGRARATPMVRSSRTKACYTTYYPGKRVIMGEYRPPTCDPKQEVMTSNGKFLQRRIAARRTI